MKKVKIKKNGKTYETDLRNETANSMELAMKISATIAKECPNDGVAVAAIGIVFGGFLGTVDNEKSKKCLEMFLEMTELVRVSAEAFYKAETLASYQ